MSSWTFQEAKTIMTGVTNMLDSVTVALHVRKKQKRPNNIKLHLLSMFDMIQCLGPLAGVFFVICTSLHYATMSVYPPFFLFRLLSYACIKGFIIVCISYLSFIHIQIPLTSFSLKVSYSVSSFRAPQATL